MYYNLLIALWKMNFVNRNVISGRERALKFVQSTVPQSLPGWKQFGKR